MPGFGCAHGVVVAVPDIGHHDGGLAEIEAFGERIVATVMDHSIDLRDDRRLGIPAGQMYVVRNIAVTVDVVADIDQSAIGQRADGFDDAFQQIGIARPQRAERHIQKRLVVIGLESGNRIWGLVAHAAFQILELGRVQRVLAAEFGGLGIKQQVHRRRGLKERANRIGGFVVLRQKPVVIVMDRLDDRVEMRLECGASGGIIDAATRQVWRYFRVGDFVFRTGNDPHPRHAELFDRRKHDDIIDTDHIRL